MEAPLLQVIHPFSHVASMIFKEAQLPGAMPAVLLEAGQLGRDSRSGEGGSRRAFSAFEGCMPGLGLLHLWFYLKESHLEYRRGFFFLMNEWSPQRFLLLTLSTHPFFSFFFVKKSSWCVFGACAKNLQNFLLLYGPQIWDLGFSTYWPIW